MSTQTDENKPLEPQASEQTLNEAPACNESLENQAEVVEDAGALAAELAQAQEKIASYHDQLLRAKAEVENIRRRADDDVSKARKFGIESFAEALIPVRDSLEAALAQSEQSLETWQEGVETTLRQLNKAFEWNHLKEVAPSAGDKFDPHLHQAISAVPSEHPEGTIAQVLQKGYTISERVLRPALVMVAAAK